MKKPRILICDDEEGIRESLRLILESDYTIEAVGDGASALSALEHSPPDLLLLDMKLPRRDGLDTLREIRRRTHNLPVLIVSAYHSAEVARESVQLGAVDYIPKPFDSEYVRDTVRRVLEEAGRLPKSAEA